MKNIFNVRHRTDAIAVSLHKEARSLLLAGLADTDPQLQEELFKYVLVDK